LGAIEIVRGGDRKKGLKKLKSLLASAEETPLEEILQKDVKTAGGF
jgi:inorganic pyrophosphatase/exopolyphosphatase